MEKLKLFRWNSCACYTLKLGNQYGILRIHDYGSPQRNRTHHWGWNCSFVLSPLKFQAKFPIASLFLRWQNTPTLLVQNFVTKHCFCIWSAFQKIYSVASQTKFPETHFSLQSDLNNIDLSITCVSNWYDESSIRFWLIFSCIPLSYLRSHAFLPNQDM